MKWIVWRKRMKSLWWTQKQPRVSSSTKLKNYLQKFTSIRWPYKTYSRVKKNSKKKYSILKMKYQPIDRKSWGRISLSMNCLINSIKSNLKLSTSTMWRRNPLKKYFPWRKNLMQPRKKILNWKNYWRKKKIVNLNYNNLQTMS